MVTCAAEQIAYKRVQASWGGATVCASNSAFLPSDAVGYVFAVGGTIEIPENADYFVFRGAVYALERAYPNAVYYGFFHDNAKRTIDLNPVMYVKTRAEVDAAYASGVAMPGGAYELATGDGYWPQGTPSEYA